MADADGVDLERLRVRRTRLGAAANELERVATSAAGDPVGWSAGVRAAVAEVRTALEDHVIEAEASGGLFAEVASTDPRLLPAVERLRHDHTDLAERLDRLNAALGAGDVDVERVREDVLAFRAELSRHRLRGADLLWELYDVDIGGGG